MDVQDTFSNQSQRYVAAILCKPAVLDDFMVIAEAHQLQLLALLPFDASASYECYLQEELIGNSLVRKELLFIHSREEYYFITEPCQLQEALQRAQPALA